MMNDKVISPVKLQVIPLVIPPESIISRKYLGVLIMVLCTFLTASGQLFFKYGSQQLEWSLSGMLTNFSLIMGFVLYGLGALVLILALRFGNLSALYPVVSLTFVWVMLISFFVLHESMNHFKISG